MCLAPQGGPASKGIFLWFVSVLLSLNWWQLHGRKRNNPCSPPFKLFYFFFFFPPFLLSWEWNKLPIESSFPVYKKHSKCNFHRGFLFLKKRARSHETRHWKLWRYIFVCLFVFQMKTTWGSWSIQPEGRIWLLLLLRSQCNSFSQCLQKCRFLPQAQWVSAELPWEPASFCHRAMFCHLL